MQFCPRFFLQLSPQILYLSEAWSVFVLSLWRVDNVQSILEILFSSREVISSLGRSTFNFLSFIGQYQGGNMSKKVQKVMVQPIVSFPIL